MALEAVEARNVRPAQLVQRPGAADEKRRAQGVAPVGAQGPVATGLIEGGLGEPGVEAHVGQQAVLFGQLLHVDLDFRGRGKAARPVGVGREAE
jgi:hypothetical protein